MSTSIRKILFTHLKRLIRVRFNLRRLIQSCKSHPLWELQLPEFVSYIEDLERQLRAIERGIYQFQLKLESALKKIYKAHCERLCLLMINGIPSKIHWLIEAKVRLAGMVSDTREDKIKFVKDGMSKESLDDILRSLEKHRSGFVQLYKKIGWEAYPRPIKGVQAVTGRKTRGRCEPQSQLPINSMTASSSKQFKNICVLSRFHYGKYKEFVQAGVDLGRVIVERKLHLVYGEGERGLSRLVSEAVFTRGSQVLGIIPKAMKPLVCMSGPSIGEELVVSSMQERIYEMLNHADAFIFLPGDLATFEALITFAS
ncbi:hypothetical protein WN943_006171 [Citrus x changshan-huyou]